jgi:hypothetical protein
MSKRNLAEQAIADAAREAARMETARCVEATRLCCEAGRPDLMLEMIESRRTIEEVSVLLRRAAVTARWDRTITNAMLPN